MVQRDLASRVGVAAVVAAALAGWVSQSAEALDPNKAITQYTLRVWRTEDGLPQDAVTAITQARDGALWVGSPSGLMRFDGAEFSRLEIGRDGSPADRYVAALLTATDGTVWAATRGALVAVAGKSWQRFGVEAGLPAAEAAALAETSDGSLWLATARGLAHFSHGRGVLVDLPVEGGIVATSALTSGTEGPLWVATDRGLVALVPPNGAATLRQDPLPSAIVSALHRDRAGRVWIGTSLGLAMIDKGPAQVPTPVRPLEGVWIRSLLEDRDGNLWIGTRGAGVFRLRGDRLDSMTVANGLPSDLVRQIFEDRDGALWLATAGGLARLTDGPVTTWTVSEGLTSRFVWTVHEDSAGTLWVGTSGGGVLRLTAGGFEPPGFAAAALAGVEVRSFLSDPDGTLWIGTGGRGLAQVRDGRVAWIETGMTSPGQWVYCLLRDRARSLWVGTGAGLVRIDAAGATTRFDREPSTAPVVVRSLAEDAAGVIWAGLADGLARVEGDRLVAAVATDGLAGDRVHAIRHDRRGVRWLATDGGLLRSEGGRSERFSTREGLPVDMLYWVIEDGDDLWLSSDAGILRLSRTQIEELRRGTRSRLEPIVLGRGDGMRATEGNSGHPAGVRRRDGSFCFATSDGVSCADPKRLRVLAEAPRPEIGALVVDGVARSLPSADAASAIEIPSGIRRVELRFGAIALVAPEKLGFRYRLEGLDADWIEVGAARTAQFTPLPPGPYRFAVAARRGGGAWSEPPATLAFRVRPAFHQTWVFAVLVALAISLVAALAVWLRTHQLAARARLLGSLVEERTRDLEHANSALERLSLADGLTGIANRRHFDHRLVAEWRRATRSRAPVSLVLADVDQFKLYNDSQGHLAGDECLRAIASALGTVAQRAQDLVARYGGEELAILLPGTDAADARLIAESARAAVECLRIEHSAGAQRWVTLSLGVATVVPQPPLEPETLVAAADRCLYRAKANGRNRVESG
jgi:diguanylate cyclase (GGDEF)-like protein